MNWKKFTLGAMLGFAGFMCLAAGPTGLGTRQIYTDVPVAINLSSVAAKEGSSPAVCRADHVHALAGTLPAGSGGTGAGALNCPNQFLTSNGTAYSCSTDTLASAQHANQGTTTTLLHGNAVGNPAWSAVSLTADVTGTTPIANGGTNSATTLNNNRTVVSSGGALVEAAAGTTGQCWAGVTGAAPTWTACASGTLAPWSTGTKPLTPDSRDEEFEGDCGVDGSGKLTLTGWTVDTGVVSTAIDPYANFNTAGAWRFNCDGNNGAGTARSGWLRFQLANTGSAVAVIHKAVTVGTNDLVWARLSMTIRTLNPAVGDQTMCLWVGASSAGAPDASNGVLICPFATNASATDVAFGKVVAGVFTLTHWTAASAAVPNNNMQGSLDTVAIQKIGTTFYGWIGTNGTWAYIGSTTYAGTTDRVWLRPSNGTNNTVAPGAPVSGVDFIRWQATSTGLP